MPEFTTPNSPAFVIFDLDGTLLDTLTDLALTTNRVLESLAYPIHSIEDYRYLVGDGVRVLFQRALPVDVGGDAKMIERCVALFEQEYEQRWDEHSAPYPGIPELLDTLVSRNASMAILSNKPQPFTEKCTAKLLARWSFDPIFGQRPGVPRKPDPAGVHQILTNWNIPPERCLYVGDTNTDMQTGRAAGCRTVGVTWGFRPEAELRAAGANLIIHNPAELLLLF